jgi:hypothetical protein
MTASDEKKLPTREEIDSLKSLPPLDCGDNSCLFAPKKGGMRTNGGCRCVVDLKPFSKRIAVTRAMQALPSLLNAAEECERRGKRIVEQEREYGPALIERDALRARLAKIEELARLVGWSPAVGYVHADPLLDAIFHPDAEKERSSE